MIPAPHFEVQHHANWCAEAAIHNVLTLEEREIPQEWLAVLFERGGMPQDVIEYEPDINRVLDALGLSYTHSFEWPARPALPMIVGVSGDRGAHLMNVLRADAECVILWDPYDGRLITLRGRGIYDLKARALDVWTFYPKAH